MGYTKCDYFKFASAYNQLAGEYEKEENMIQAYINRKMEIISLLKCGIITGLPCYRDEEETSLNCENLELLVKAYKQSCVMLGRRFDDELLTKFSKLEDWEYTKNHYDILMQLSLDLRCIRYVDLDKLIDYGNDDQLVLQTEDAILDYISNRTSPYLSDIIRNNESNDVFDLLGRIALDEKHFGKNRLDVLLGGK